MTAFQNAVERAVELMRTLSPKKTGNMAYNGIRYEFLPGNKAEIYIDADIAPYVYYTNEPWISPKWNGRINPNEGWIDRAVYRMAQEIANELGGELKDD